MRGAATAPSRTRAFVKDTPGWARIRPPVISSATHFHRLPWLVVLTLGTLTLGSFSLFLPRAGPGPDVAPGPASALPPLRPCWASTVSIASMHLSPRHGGRRGRKGDTSVAFPAQVKGRSRTFQLRKIPCELHSRKATLRCPPKLLTVTASSDVWTSKAAGSDSATSHSRLANPVRTSPAPCRQPRREAPRDPPLQNPHLTSGASRNVFPTEVRYSLHPVLDCDWRRLQVGGTWDTGSVSPCPKARPVAWGATRRLPKVPTAKKPQVKLFICLRSGLNLLSGPRRS